MVTLKRSAMAAGRAAVASMALATVMTAGAADASDRLREAVKAGDRAAVTALLKQRVDVNSAEPDGATALHWAVRADDTEIAGALVRAGANVRATNRYGVTPLALAAVNGNPATIELLLTAGADPNTATPEGETALMTAARTGTLAAARLLLDHGANVNARERWNGESALMWAAGENHGALAKLLIERGADVNATSTVLQYPDVKIDVALVWRVELPRGGLTPLMFAARQGALESVRVLTEMGADVNLTDPDGTSALVTSIINAHYDVAALLLEKRADPNLADAAGMTPLYAAVDMHLKEPMFNRPVPKASGRLGTLDVIEALLKGGANPNVPLKAPLLGRQHDSGDPLLGEGATPLLRAAKASDATLIDVLAAHGADPSLKLKNGTTIAMLTAARLAPNVKTEQETLAVLKSLLGRGVDINAANDKGDTALHLAVGKSDEVVKFLVDRGAKLDAKDEAGRTPLDVALGVAPKGREGRPGTPGPVHETTATLLRQLISAPR